MICRRVRHVKPFLVMDVLEKAQAMERAGESVIHLEVGEPDFPAPKAVLQAAVEALQRGETHYTHSLGLWPLREALCVYYAKTYGVTDLEPDQILVTSGSSPAFLIALSTLMDCGEEVILSNPHYACYPSFVTFLDGVPKLVPVDEEDGFQLRAEAVRRAISPRTRAVLINSPSNPTGTLMDKEHLEALADLGLWILSDEIYHGLVYKGRAHSILEFTRKAIVFNGFSKLFAMTGLRLGYLVVPKDLVRPMQALMQNFFISANSVSQWAGLAALTVPEVQDDVARMVRTYDERRRFMIHRLRTMGFGIAVEPTGAFYVFANAKRFSHDSLALAFEILEKARVGVTPGVDFGSRGEGYLRFSYANSMENIAEAMNRLERFLAQRSS
ncbi:pyridoxal phosphate-dependent aminotransferase [Desulfosoma caldarium]|uniref:Aminotransferase n=1 Tax=Desulfosoma caldarium TaxID=610254 RepID=A0A3N1VNI1_9BACT|nr:pyridoxal phosphate-dependent aminotransferase [Desulfosoma caldarium]ROR01477.1 aspartate/methionine/tyrosine aminotransferase [Desulfosoma caldarium]